MRRYHVPAGSYRVSRREPLLLQAFLGTCVGVALHCRATGIGGLIHLLLPAPVSAAGERQPEKYAVTGLPLLIREVLAAGARRESLSAVIAGGALVGPVSSRDLDLDIGGRTVESVKQILADEGIAVTQSETGGFFTCSLDMDMRDGSCTIEPIGSRKAENSVPAAAPSPDDIRKTLDRLQPIPQVALKILRLVHQDGEYDIESLAHEVRHDQVLAARTLQLANSAMFGTRSRIESLDHALVFLGQDLLVQLVVSAAVESYFGQSDKGYSLCKGGIYHHAVGCARAAEALARGMPPEFRCQAYTAGLLHDIGKVVLDQAVASAYPLFYRGLNEEEVSFVELEKRLLGTDHTAAGHSLAQLWGLPDTLAETIQCHHQPGTAQHRPDLAAIVHLADLMLSRFDTSFEVERMDTSELLFAMKQLKLDDTGLAGIVDRIPAAVFAQQG